MKTNIGHLEGGSGIAGVIKVVLSLENGIIPPASENFNSPNPAIDLDYLNLKVCSPHNQLGVKNLIYCWGTGCHRPDCLGSRAATSICELVRVWRDELPRHLR